MGFIRGRKFPGENMTFESFQASLQNESPPLELPALLQAMWYDGKGDWDAAHSIAQDIDTADGSWVHAYLHRKEGDNFNAGYWYRRANKPASNVSLDEEWEEIVRAMLQ